MAKQIWKAQRTLLIVGEGSHEEAFLRHVKSVFVTRRCGLRVKITNAKGKGARHVIDFTIRLSNNVAYDNVAALFDTDQDCTDKVKALAQSNNITMLKSVPCLEVMLLHALNLDCKGNSKALKNRLAKQLTGDAGESTSYARCFTRDFFEKTNEPTLLELIQLLSPSTK